MTGDDWLNNGVSRNRFRHYLETELNAESQATISRIKQECEDKKISYTLSLLVGDSEKSLHTLASRKEYHKIFIGELRPRNVCGLNDRMLSRRNRWQFKDVLNVIPHPDG